MSVKSLEAKVVIIGSNGVGKTCLTLRYLGQKFNFGVSPTIGASFFTAELLVDGVRIKLQLWDTGGQERFRSMVPLYYRNSNASLVVFDLSSRESFFSCKQWIKELNRNVDSAVICLVGNKSDLINDRCITREEAEQYAAQINARFFETSALMHEGIEEVFLYISTELLKFHHKNKTKLQVNKYTEEDQHVHEESNLDGSQKTSCCSII